MRSSRRAVRVVERPGSVRVEREGDALRGDAPVAVMSSWTKTAQMSLSLSQYLFRLEEIGFRSLLVNASGFSSPLEWPHGIPVTTTVVRRDNIGYDFGSWSSALRTFPWIRAHQAVLLTNDSMVGPFASLDTIADAARASHADLFGLTESYQGAHHPQSYFLLFRGGVLAERPWTRFFDAVREEETKEDIVRAYEFGVPRVCSRYGYSWETMVGADAAVSGEGNPTFDRWRYLLEAGIPFVKRSLITDSDYQATVAEVAGYVQWAYGQNLREWLPEGYFMAGRQRGEAGE